MPVEPFQIVVPTGPRVPVIAHVPHASTVVPPWVRHQIVLSEAEFERELVRLTDWRIDELFSWVPAVGGSLFVNRLSRLVFDPERFADDAEEPMAAVGQGVVYTHTTQGALLAAISEAERERRLRELYQPYHRGLTALVAATIEEFGRALLLDCHSFASIPLPSELDQTRGRPDLCLGTDSFHTPPALARTLAAAFAAEGLSVRFDRPFAGTLVPRDFRGDERLRSVMSEVRRGLYCDEATGERSACFADTRAKVERAVSLALASAFGGGMTGSR